MNATDIAEHVVGPVRYMVSGIETLRHLPPGDNLVTDSPLMGQGRSYGIVHIKRKGMLARLYTTSFTPLCEAGGAEWDGELESRFRMMSEGVWHYRDDHHCGTHRLYLLGNGVIRVYVRDEGKPEYLEPLYWIKIQQKRDT